MVMCSPLGPVEGAVSRSMHSECDISGCASMHQWREDSSSCLHWRPVYRRCGRDGRSFEKWTFEQPAGGGRCYKVMPIRFKGALRTAHFPAPSYSFPSHRRVIIITTQILYWYNKVKREKNECNMIDDALFFFSHFHTYSFGLFIFLCRISHKGE